MNSSTLSRRQLLAGSAVAGLTLGSISTAKEPKTAGKTLRAGHITDVHIKKELNAPQGVAQLFAHMFGQKDWQPDLVLNTGDTVFAVDGNTSGAKAAEQIELWKKAREACNVPIYSCLGNHDVWGGNVPTAELPLSSKGFALMTGVLGMPAPYYSFDMGAWHFISLNSMANWPNYGTLTPEHLAWLKEDLAKTPKDRPVCVLSHMPILSVTGMTYGEEARKANGNLVPGVWMHTDCFAITEVFRKHPNVKLCLSGHMHTCDRCEYRGVWYICGGAASGAWWNGAEYGFPPMYGQLNLHEDGSFQYNFTDYNWPTRQYKGKQL
jgi:3',5'-cyclic-AMP phosphodiesterase